MNETVAQPDLQPANPHWKKIRIGFLIAVHVALFLHLYFYYGLDRKAVGSIDFQELFRMFLKEGVLNAGAIFALVVFAGTMLFGRVFCGWACHFGAFQELCHEILKRTPLKVVARHSIALKIIPVFALVYFILWPNLAPLAKSGLPASMRVDISATPIWELLPGPAVGIAMFLFDGMLIVLFFGTRAFCRLVCPWGAMLKPFNYVSMSAITKINDCIECKSCNDNCQMDIDVMGYANSEGKVNASECIKCMNCVSVCPQGALGFRFKPQLSLGNFKTRHAHEPGMSLKEGIAVLLIAVAGLFALMHLGTVSPLLSVVVGAITGYSAVVLVRAIRGEQIQLFGMNLQAGKKWNFGGVSFALITFAMAFLILWGGSFKVTRFWANHQLKNENFQSALLPLGAAIFLSPNDATLRLAKASAKFELGHKNQAVALAQQAVDTAPENVTGHQLLADYLLADGKEIEAADEYEKALAIVPTDHQSRVTLCKLYKSMGDEERLRQCYRTGAKYGTFKAIQPVIPPKP